MADLVTIEEAKAHLRVDSTADDTWLAVFIPAISQAVLMWLKDEWRAYELLIVDGVVQVDSSDEPIIYEDSNGPVVKPVVKAAVLVELAQQYRFRDGGGAAKMESLGAVAFTAAHGYILGQGATALLSALHKGTVR